MPSVEQIHRMKKANELIQLISSLDRRFFYSESKNRVAHFEFRPSGKLFFIDNYTGQAVYPYHVHHGRAKGFSHGGTLWDLVNSMREFIVHGKFGWLCDFKETWAYSLDSTMKVREKAKEIGFIETTDYPYVRFGE